MRAFTVILMFVVAATMIDSMLAWLAPARLLRPHVCVTIGGYGMTASLLLMPVLLIYALAKPPANHSLGFSVSLAVLASWFMTLQFRMQFGLPALRELARRRGNITYDGLGMNACLLVAGWLPPLIVSLLAIGVLQRFRARTEQSAT